LSEFASIPEVAKHGLLKHLPARLIHQLQEKTKKKLMKEQTMQAPPKVEHIPPVIIPRRRTAFPSLSILVNTLKNNVPFLEQEGTKLLMPVMPYIVYTSILSMLAQGSVKP
jgi:hypothetical protein